MDAPRLGALELNDSGLILRRREEGVLAGPPASPACAFFGEAELLIGEEASARARLLPRRIHDRFWAELGLQSLPKPFPPRSRSADLARLHLASLLDRSGVEALLVAVPGSFTAEQLGLLVGIAGSLGSPVHGLIDSAVAASHLLPPVEHAVHVDLELHRAVLTELEGGGGWRRGAARVLPGAGLAASRQAWAQRAGTLFVERTRFQPFASAAAEQSLWEQLPEVARRLCTEGSLELRLPSGGGERILELAAFDLVEAAAPILESLRVGLRRSLAQGRPTQLVLTQRASSVPGLHAVLAEVVGGEPVVLPEEAAAAGALRHLAGQGAPDMELPFHSRLPVTGGG